MASHIRRRELIVALAGAAAWPMVARAQQPAMPVIGFLSLISARGEAARVAAFKQRLSQTGYTEGQNVAIEFRYAESQYDRLTALAGDLVRRRPAAIFAAGPSSVRAIKAHSTTVPIVFQMGEDPVKEGLVA